MRAKQTDSPDKILSDYLVQQGMKLTSQRKLILAEFFKTDMHLSAEDLYQHLKSMYPSLGQATVYRTMKLIRDAGLAQQLRFGDNVARFEPKTDSGHHDHLICTECGKNQPVFDVNIEKLQKKLAQKHGFKLTSHRMYLYGICAGCRKKTAPAQ